MKLPKQSRIRPETAQQQQDEVLSKNNPSPQQVEILKAYLQSRANASSLNPRSPEYDPIEAAMARHPGLTREQAEKMAEAFGF